MRFADAAKRKLELLQLDIVHDMGAGYYCDIFQPHWGSRIAVFEQKLLMSHPWLRGPKRMTLFLPRYRQILQLSSRQFGGPVRMYIALSQMVARSFHLLHGLKSHQMRLIYNGVDVDVFSPHHREIWRNSIRRQLNVGQQEVLLLLVAHNLRLKGLPTTLRALAALLRDGQQVKLLVVGGNRLSSFKRLSAKLGVADHVLFVGPVTDPVPYYSAADIFVHPTFYDPCSLVVLEAMASGLPVITSRFNGVSELMTQGIEGHVLQDPSDCHELVRWLRHLMDSHARQAMARAARRLAELHPLDANFEQIVNLYEEVCERKVGGAMQSEKNRSWQPQLSRAG
jgi:UDP-glucose:(heptosyl)LPS alpha-1,3-glucosyltransferase